ncbi:MAG: amino acid deaminase [Bryobacteraceae bacterium]
MNIQEIINSRLDGTTKGLPFDAVVSPATVAAKKWNVLRQDLHFPLLVLKESPLDYNIKAMARWCADNGFLLAPHGKTTMCPQIYQRQLEAGAFGITVANVSQLLVCVRFGVKRILVANQIVGAANVRSLVGAMNADAGLECYCLVDSVEGTRLLARLIQECGAQRPLKVLLEWGRKGWRTGARTLSQAIDIYEEILKHPNQLAFGGIEGYEALAHDPAGEEVEVQQTREFLSAVARLTAEISGRRHGDLAGLILSIGGTSYLDLVWEALTKLDGQYKPVLRSGCYVTHDHGFYAERMAAMQSRNVAKNPVPVFRPALELWSYIQSIPDENRAILTFGRRDCPYDVGLPLPLCAVALEDGLDGARSLESARITAVNDQHAFMSFPGGVSLRVGDKICCGISHPCTAFDKWRAIPLVDENYDVIDLYLTYF